MAIAGNCAMLLSLLFMLVAGCLCDGATDVYNILDFEMARKHESWMAEHGRVYKDEAEKARRFEIYRSNMKKIEEFHRAGNQSYTMGETPFTDLTDDEFLATYTSEIDVSVAASPCTNGVMNYTNLPASVNWTAANKVTYVKYQGGCGSCWSFVTTAVVESLTAIKKNQLRNLSPQQLIDCDKRNKGCSGGTRDVAFDYVKNKGIATLTTYPYTGKQGTCNTTKEKQRFTPADITGCVRVPKNNETALMAAVAKQPVGIGLKVHPDFSRFKGSGIYRGPCGKVMNHGGLLVGYGGTGTNKYWLVKNSWGQSWGDKGYAKIERGISDVTGRCGIAIYNFYPTM